MTNFGDKDQDVSGGSARVSLDTGDQPHELTTEEAVVESQLVRKLDMRILPLLVLVYLMNWIDRQNYSAAKLQGLERDLGLSSTQYQVGLSVMYVGYLLGGIPSNLLLNYAGRPSLYLGFWIIAWGLVSCLTSQCQGYGGIVACRAILGLVESPFFAGALFYLSKWYTKKEIAFRTVIFYTGSLLSGAFGNLLAAGILQGLDGAHGWSSWRWLYIIEGSLTMFIGFCVCVLLPDFPHTWKRLSPAMKRVANRRMAVDHAQADLDDGGAMSQLEGLKQAVLDPKTYLIATMHLCTNAAGGFQNFFPALAQTLGYNKVISLLLVSPPYVVMAVWILIHGRLSDRMQVRSWFFLYPIPFILVGWIIFMTTDSFGPRYFSFFLMSLIFAQSPTMYSWVSSSVPRPPAKRASVYAIMNMIGNSSSIWTPFTYRSKDSPHYVPALCICIGFEILGGIAALLLRWTLIRQNRELERKENEDEQLSNPQLEHLRVTAEIEGTNMSAARQLQKGYRYIL